MSVFDTRRHSPKGYKLVVLGLVAAICSVVALTAFSIGQSRTQHQICQVIGFVGDQTRHSIVVTNQRLKVDNAAHRAIDAESLTKLNTFYAKVTKVKC